MINLCALLRTSNVLPSIVLTALFSTPAAYAGVDIDPTDIMMSDMKWSLKPGTVDGYRYVPTVRYVPFAKEKRVYRIRLYKGKKVVLDASAGKDDNMSFVFVARPLAKAVLAKRTQLTYDGPARLSGDVTSKLPIIWKPAGEQEPMITIGEYSGGAHCCYTYTSYLLGSKVRKLENPAGGDSVVTFGRLRGSDQMIAVAYDTSYGYWNACFADSPAPLVVMELKNGKWQLAPDKMRVQAFAPDMVAKAVADCKSTIASASIGRKLAAAQFSLEPTIWATMLEFIYTGQANNAWKFLDDIWPEGKVGVLQPFPKELKLDQAEFKKLFKAKLHDDAFFKELVALNKGQEL
jgi:hypothetical protein